MKKKKTGNSVSSQNWFDRDSTTWILIAVFLLGVMILLYPSFSDYWNSFHQTRAIMSYSETVSNLSSEDYEREIDLALDYNRKVGVEGVNWTMSEEELKEYEEILNFAGNGIMGYIKIDKIKVTLPIYHGISEAVLQTSIGHIEGTSLPVGAYSYDYELGKVTDATDGSHCVLSGHRGLPSAKLFSDLDKMVEGDTFNLNILGETYTYQVDQIRVVEPTDLSEIQIVEGQDYCTLVTCTPYGINTHRLLVRGHRVDNPQGDVSVIADAIVIDSVYVAPFIAAPIIVVLILIVFLRKPKKGVKSERKKMG